MTFNLSAVTILRDEYATAGLLTSWEGSFINSITTSKIAPRGRGVEILENIMKKGSPQSWSCWGEAAEILKIAETCNRPDEAVILRDFAARVQQNKPLSEKQKWFLEKLKSGATRDMNIHTLSDRDAKLMNGAENKMSMTSYYWANRPATHCRLKKIFEKFNKSDKVAIDREEWEFVRNSFKGLVSLWETSLITHSAGSLCQVSNHFIDKSQINVFQIPVIHDALIVSESIFNKCGDIVIDVLVNGTTVTVCTSNLVLPRKARKKKGEV